MEIISIDSNTFDNLKKRLEKLHARVERLSNQTLGKTLGEWLDNQDVCNILNIAPRTLQTYRNNGTLAHSKIEHKIYYRSEDVSALLNKLTIRNQAA